MQEQANRQDATDVIKICVFGDFRIRVKGKLLPPFPTKASEMLFTFLVLNRSRLFQRDTLAHQFFDDQSSCGALKRLRNDIWRIRSILEPDGVEPGTYLTVTKREVGFNPSGPYWLDSQEFENALAKISLRTNKTLQKNDFDLLTNALGLYRGDLLEGTYDDWCVWEKERLKMLNLRAMEILMRHHEAKMEWQEAITLGEHLISKDPLREHIHRGLMRFYYQAGDRPVALLKYRNCSRLLHDELNIEPMSTTTKLFEAIRSETLISGGASDTNHIAIENKRQSTMLVQNGIADIYNLATQLDELAGQLKEKIQLFERIRR